jgi:hypothetical protein
MKISENIQNIIKKRAIQHLQKLKKVNSSNLSMYKNVLYQNEQIKPGYQKKITLSKNTILVLADFAPDFNWGHPCQILLFNAEMGELYQVIDSDMPPMSYLIASQDYIPLHQPVTKPVYPALSEIKRTEIPLVKSALHKAPGKRYALLFSGMSDYWSVYSLDFMYRTLIDIYNFDPANIKVLNYDGTLNYSGHPPSNPPIWRLKVNASGTAYNLGDYLEHMGRKLKEDDLSFIFTVNHGYRSLFGFSSIVCYSPYSFISSSCSCIVFCYILSKFKRHAASVIVMNQCYAGGFKDYVIKCINAKWTHFASACKEDQKSGDQFALHWISGIGQIDYDGHPVNSDKNNDGRISLLEAFEYAKTKLSKSQPVPIYIDKPSGYSKYMFLGLPAHDLYIRDNLQDNGEEPLPEGGISASPDIIIFNQPLADPEATLGTSESMNRDELGDPIEFGQDNYIYLRVHNRGKESTSGMINLYWSYPSPAPIPSSWKYIGDTQIPPTVPNSSSIVEPIIWPSSLIPAPEQINLIAVVQSGDDPAPDLSSIQTPEDFYYLVKESNNVTFKNQQVIDAIKGSVISQVFYIYGWTRFPAFCDLEFDLHRISQDTIVTIKLLKRITNGAYWEEMELHTESEQYRTFEAIAGEKCFIREMSLQAKEFCRGYIKFELPVDMQPDQYIYSIKQFLGGNNIGGIFYNINVMHWPYIANRKSYEVHKNDCKWVKKMYPSNMIAFRSIETALKNGYNGCVYCLPEYDTDFGIPNIPYEPNSK